MTTYRIRASAHEPEPGDHFLCPECDRLEEVSLTDWDASWAEMLSHIKIVHPSVSQSPNSLWPRIALVTDVQKEDQDQ